MDDRLFPLNFLQDLSLTQQRTLRAIVVTTPVHVHVPSTHIGMVYGDTPGQRVNALELILCLRATYGRLVNTQTGLTPRRHTVHSPRVPSYQSQFVPRLGDYPDGYGSLLTNNEIWGLEPISFEGYSVIHLART